MSKFTEMFGVDIIDLDGEIDALIELGQEAASNCAKKDKELSKLRRQLEEKEDEIERLEAKFAAADIQRPITLTGESASIFALLVENGELKEEIAALRAQQGQSTVAVHGHPVYRNRHEHYDNYVMTGRTDDGEALYRKEHHVLSNISVGCCSECGKILCSRFNNYCPNCGTKMDGGDNCG